jgi:hypothetical protein
MPVISAEGPSAHFMDRIVRTTAASITTTLSSTEQSTTLLTSTAHLPTTTTDGISTSARTFFQSGFNNLRDAILESATTTPKPKPYQDFDHDFSNEDSAEEIAAVTVTTLNPLLDVWSAVTEKVGSIFDLRPNLTSNIDHTFPPLPEMFQPHAEALSDLSTIPPFHKNVTSCERVNIMGTIVQDSTPYLYPFIIEYSLIGAAVIYVMWKHIGRYPK